MKSARFLLFLGLVSNVTLTAGEMPRTVARPDSGSSLSFFIKQALKVNPRLQAAQSRAGASAARIGQAGAWDDPQIGVEFFATPVTSANPFKDGMETDYFIQQMIPLGKKGPMSDAAAAGARMAEESARAVERNLIADVSNAYAMIYSAQRRIAVNDENQRFLAQIEQSAVTRYRVGLMSQADVLKVQVEQAKLQNERSGLEQELTRASAMMNALRVLPAATLIDSLPDPPLAPIVLSREELLARALESRPELRAMGYELEMRRADLTASRRERLPDLMVRGMYKQMTEGIDQWAAMFSVNIPIAPWSSGRTSGKVEENELTERATEQSLADMKNMVQAEALDAWSGVTSRWEKIDRFRQSILPQSEQSLQSMLVAFQTGKADFLSLLDSYRMLQMLKMEYYMTISEYVASVAQLEKATGTDLR